MAYGWGPVHAESYPAGADLSASQFCIGKRQADGTVILAAAAGQGDGIIDFTTPATLGQTVALIDDGTVKVVAGGTIALGDPLTSDANGHAITGVTGNKVFGKAREAAVAGQVFTARVDFSGAGTV